MPSRLTLLLLTIVILAIIVPNTPSGGGALAFGAGNIPGFAYLEGKAFRHGDIEDVLADLLKKSAGSGLLGLGGGSKFGGLDVKRVYFGNWLRDYSQAVDIAGLKQVQIQTILNIVTVLGFMAHGYATGAFEVTAERLGTYLPVSSTLLPRPKELSFTDFNKKVEHIDNPKGYGEGEDPRKYHPKLRGPVHPQEYAVDPQTGMKNYIANENGFWDTSKAHVRRLIIECIEEGRRYRQGKNQENKFNAYRTLGSALHTLEDFFAHSNFCELTLISIGGWNVFPHVGERTKIPAPNGQYVYPLVTGTFGGSDFIHSVLGEATDHLSQSSLTELNTQIDTAHKKQNTGGGIGSIANIKALSAAVPGVGGPGSEMDREVDSMERNRAGTQGKNPNQMSPQEIRSAIWPVLVFRDNLVMKIEMVIEKIPGLQEALESLMESIQVFVLTTLEPYIRPLIEAATKNLMETSGAMYAVPLITAAWDNPSINPTGVANEILECLFHPDWHNRNSKIQVQIMTYMGKWMNSHGTGTPEVQRRLTKESVRNHQNIRFSGQVQGIVSADHAHPSQPKLDLPGLGIPGAPGLGGGGGGDPLASVIGALGKMGVSPGPGGPSRDFGSAGDYYSGGPQAPRYQPPPGPPGGQRQPSVPSYGAPAYSPPAGPPPGRGGPGFPDAGTYRSDSGYKDDKYREKEEKRARKEEEKRKKKEKKKGEYGGRDYDDSEDSEDDYRKKDKGEKKGGGTPWYEAPSGGYQLHGRDNERSRDSDSGRDRDRDRDRSRDRDRGYAPPAGPPPGQGSSFGASSFSMPSAPGGPPSFPSAPGFGGPPSFPSAPGFPSAGPNMNPSEFGNFFPPPGGPPPNQGGFPGSNNNSGYPGSGYPGGGGRHEYHGSSSGW
ncbi:hypothetical protein FS837_012538 [Tulasnella sp. UAMH 9824]|nr:hypothetical protein FS837_012538 [Tulasnella sp. UAMH 9824]